MSEQEKSETVYIRASGLSRLVDCPRRWVADTAPEVAEMHGAELNKEPSRGVASIIGSAVHAGMAEFAKTSSHSGSADASRKFFKNEDLTDIPSEDWPKDSPDSIKALKQVERLLDAALSATSDWWHGREERRFTSKLKAKVAGRPLALTGRPDLITEDGVIADIKTAGRVPSGGHTAHWAQVGAYDLLVRQAEKLDIKEGRVVTLPRHTLKRMQDPARVDHLDARLARKEAERAIGYGITILQEYAEKEELPPANPSSVLCSQKYCVAYATDFCPITKGSSDE